MTRTPESATETEDVQTTAAHILVLLDSVEQQLKTIRASAERLIAREGSGAAQS